MKIERIAQLGEDQQAQRLKDAIRRLSPGEDIRFQEAVKEVIDGRANIRNSALDHHLSPEALSDVVCSVRRLLELPVDRIMQLRHTKMRGNKIVSPRKISSILNLSSIDISWVLRLMEPGITVYTTPEEEQAIIRRLRETNKSIPSIASEFGLSRHAVGDIVRRLDPDIIKRPTSRSDADSIHAEYVILVSEGVSHEQALERLLGEHPNSTAEQIKTMLRYRGIRVGETNRRIEDEEAQAMLDMLRGGASLRQTAINFGRSMKGVRDAAERIDPAWVAVNIKPIEISRAMVAAIVDAAQRLVKTMPTGKRPSIKDVITEACNRSGEEEVNAVTAAKIIAEQLSKEWYDKHFGKDVYRQRGTSVAQRQRVIEMGRQGWPVDYIVDIALSESPNVDLLTAVRRILKSAGINFESIRENQLPQAFWDDVSSTYAASSYASGKSLSATAKKWDISFSQVKRILHLRGVERDVRSESDGLVFGSIPGPYTGETLRDPRQKKIYLAWRSSKRGKANEEAKANEPFDTGGLEWEGQKPTVQDTPEIDPKKMVDLVGPPPMVQPVSPAAPPAPQGTYPFDEQDMGSWGGYKSISLEEFERRRQQGRLLTKDEIENIRRRRLSAGFNFKQWLDLKTADSKSGRKHQTNGIEIETISDSDTMNWYRKAQEELSSDQRNFATRLAFIGWKALLLLKKRIVDNNSWEEMVVDHDIRSNFRSYSVSRAMADFDYIIRALGNPSLTLLKMHPFLDVIKDPIVAERFRIDRYSMLVARLDKKQKRLLWETLVPGNNSKVIGKKMGLDAWVVDEMIRDIYKAIGNPKPALLHSKEIRKMLEESVDVPDETATPNKRSPQFGQWKEDDESPDPLGRNPWHYRNW
jgi:transposase-like protein